VQFLAFFFLPAKAQKLQKKVKKKVTVNFLADNKIIDRISL